MTEFYKNVAKLDGVSKIEKPTRDDIGRLIEIIRKDDELAVYFYDHCKNGAWVKILKEAGEFKDLEETEVTKIGRFKASYLLNVAGQAPDEVIEIISSIEAKDAFVQSKFLDVLYHLLDKEYDVASQASELIKNYLEKRVYKMWYVIGEAAAELMKKIVESQPDKAFEIAETLLEIWIPEEKSILKELTARFEEFHYRELIFDYCKELWEIDALRATKLLADIFDKGLDELAKEDDYAIESGFHIKIERLDQVRESYLEEDVVVILVRGICEAGKTVIEKQPGRVDELLDYLWDLKKTIFERIVMYLIRFVPKGEQKERINTIIGDRKYLERRYWWYEYRLLLRDKFEEVDTKAKNVFKAWIEEKVVSDEEQKRISLWFKEHEEREATENDFEKIENNRKARELYLVKDKIPELYEKYKEKSGASDADLMPIPRIGEISPVYPTEGSPISIENMLKMEPRDALAYINEPSRWEIDKKKEIFFHTPEEGLEGTFEKVVQQKVKDYAKLKADDLLKLKPIFLKRYFHGAWNALREKQLKKETLVKILQRANNVIVDKNGSEDYEGVFRSIIYVVEGIFEDEPLRKQLIKENGKDIWGIIETLSRYEDKREETDKDGDPHQRSINCITGKAFTLVVRFGLSYKKEDSKTHEKEWSEKIRGVLGYVVDNVKDARIRCVLGVWFPQLHWLEKEWVETKLDNIFDIGDEKAWDIVWGTYMSWGRAYKNTFGLLVKRGKYNYAVEKIESGIYREHDKNPDEGLVEHLMIGYFNEWVDIEDNLLKKFFETASAKLRGKAARFLTTGFKSVNEKGGEQKEKVATRMKAYWKKRLEEMREKPKENIDEAIKFTGWVKDTLLKPKETLELLEQTLDLSGGKFGQMRGAREFIGRICELGNGNELIALRCIKKAVADEHIQEPWARYEERLVEFLEQISELPNEYENVKDILNEAVEVADLYGRLQPDKFRGIWEGLNKRLRESEV